MEEKRRMIGWMPKDRRPTALRLLPGMSYGFARQTCMRSLRIWAVNARVSSNIWVNPTTILKGSSLVNTSTSMAARDRHIPPVSVQAQHVQAARTNPQLRASVNRGKPPVAATPRPGAFNDRAVAPAKEAGAPYNRPVNRGAAQPRANTPAPRAENSVPPPN